MRKIQKTLLTQVQVGQLYEVHTSFPGYSDRLKRKILLEVGEVIEIRYPFEWHFRTMDDMYLQADEDVLLANCNYYGKVFSEVWNRNICKTKDIVKLLLYEPNNGTN